MTGKISLLFLFVASLAAADQQPVSSVGGNCKAKAEQAVREKFDVKSGMQMNGAAAQGDSVFTFGFAYRNNDCTYFYDVKINPTFTVPAKDELGNPTREAVSCDILKVSKSDDPQDCG